jgi:hypothetical protein
MSQDQKSQPLYEEIEQILEEARMVLPGLQALFGFQLIAVFNERFDQVLSESGRQLHLAALILTAIAIGLVMAPAAYHRMAERDRVSRYFARYASTLIALAMGPLALALSIEVSLVAYLVTRSSTLSWAIGGALIIGLGWLWYAFPAFKRLRASSTAHRGARR